MQVVTTATKHTARASRAPAASSGAARGLDRAAAALAIATLLTVAGITLTEQQTAEREDATARPTRATIDAHPLETTAGEVLVAGYVGVPATDASDVRFQNPAAGDDYTLKAVGWDGKPFRHPLYYGVRVARWAPGNRLGVMVDFLHSKTISRPGDEVKVEGRLGGQPAPATTRIGDLFRTLEFSHGHNMLMGTGLVRLGMLMPRVSPYAGLGVGVALPHTEIRRRDEPARTYEYQYAGPVGQALVGLEIRLPGSSVFLEYKYTLADYRVPLTRRDGDLLATDLWRQAADWWRGVVPPGGEAATRLASHNFVAGAGPRFGGR